jgi:hypothetical protein
MASTEQEMMIQFEGILSPMIAPVARSTCKIPIGFARLVGDLKDALGAIIIKRRRTALSV